MGLALGLRAVAEAGAVAGPLLVWLRRDDALPAAVVAGPDEPPARSSRLPLAANVLALVAFFSTLWGPFQCPGIPAGALPVLGAAGVAVVAAGAWVMVAARRALGAAWRFVPAASRRTGLTTAGPYRFVRHPIYLGMAVSFLGTAVAFANWLSLVIYLLLVVPALAWRAIVEDRLLAQVFGSEHADYRRRTKMLIPGVM